MQKLLKELFVAYYKDVYIYLYGLSHDVDLSEELTAEVFLEAVKSIAKFRREADIKTWLFSIARHQWFGYLRKKRRQVQTEILYEFYENHEKTPETHYLERELVERIYALLEQEPERTQKIVKMRLEGFSFHEIGMKYGVSENSARVIDFRAKEKIRQRLKKEGYDVE